MKLAGELIEGVRIAGGSIRANKLRSSLATLVPARVSARIAVTRGIRSAASSVPSPSGAVVYRMNVLAEVPDSLDLTRLAKALEERAAQLGVDVSLAPA